MAIIANMKKLIILGTILVLLVGVFSFNTANAFHKEPFCFPIGCDNMPDNDSGSNQPAPNQPPVWTSGQTSYNVTVGDILQFTVSAYDPDNDPITYTVSYVPNGASFNTSTRTFTWSPANSQTGTYSLQFTASDGKSQTSQTITINVSSKSNSGSNTNSANRSPVWHQVGSQTAFVGQAFQLTVLATDPDNDSLTYSAINRPSGATFDSASRTLFWTPTSNQTGTHTVTFRADDGRTFSDMSVSILVQNSNNKPAFLNFNPPLVATVGQLYTYDINSTDADGDNRFYTIVTAPLGLVINAENGIIRWVPQVSQANLFHLVTIALSDGKDTVTQSYQIFVQNAPVVINSSTNNTPPPQPIVRLRIDDVRVEVDESGNVFMLWETNIPATARVIYDTVSQPDRVGDYSYANATSETTTETTAHRINVGNLEEGKTFYLRAVAKASGQVVVSRELSFVKLTQEQQEEFFGANIMRALGKFFGHPLVLITIITGLTVALLMQYRKQAKAKLLL